MGKRWGGWENLGSLPEGGQSWTYKVRRSDNSDVKTYVLKRVKKGIDRFGQEIRTLTRLDHPNILRIVDSDLDASEPYYVAEYCDGGTLEDYDLSTFTVIERLRLFLQICEGVAYLHRGSAWVVHRDLKPANIFMRGSTPVIGDLGLCFTSEPTERLTGVDEAAGPRLYMAPELEDGRSDAVHTAADVYSLGKMLYWMLAGRVFSREKQREPEWDLTRDRPVEPDLYLVTDLLDRMIAREPSKRIQSASEVEAEVQTIINIVSAHGHHLHIDTPQPCTFCCVGVYTVAVDEWADSSARPHAINEFGLRPHVSRWLILVCDHCGNVQSFRLDRAKNGSAWQGLKSPARPSR